MHEQYMALQTHGHRSLVYALYTTASFCSSCCSTPSSFMPSSPLLCSPSRVAKRSAGMQSKAHSRLVASTLSRALRLPPHPLPIFSTPRTAALSSITPELVGLIRHVISTITNTRHRTACFAIWSPNSMHQRSQLPLGTHLWLLRASSLPSTCSLIVASSSLSVFGLI